MFSSLSLLETNTQAPCAPASTHTTLSYRGSPHLMQPAPAVDSGPPLHVPRPAERPLRFESGHRVNPVRRQANRNMKQPPVVLSVVSRLACGHYLLQTELGDGVAFGALNTSDKSTFVMRTRSKCRSAGITGAM